ncbi:MAG TPA: RNA methyltransferase [Clostridiaceae bacterium]|jgi:putative N6-adenine-specific DNA methylase|nr:RNA methyltransferase [Clostridiaceae bacterium]HBX48502.1 RNA methyltransferase [Clostridiaceae bacterium]HCL50672.1 RNA methyltransferase [Clostridiaceae bacterium]
MTYEIIATTTFGIESIAALELKNLGYDNLKVENGRVIFSGTEEDIARCNMWLRTADRILIRVGCFKAQTFEELFQGTKAIEWGDFIPKNGFMHILGKSVKSTLFSVPDCQSIVKKAVVEAMKRKYKINWFEEDGPEYKIEISLLKDMAELTIDTSGTALHKRGYREIAGEAPLKETLAAALVLLSRWQPSRILSDPLCGSGTIPIEAALIGKNIAPGINREFAGEAWPNFNKSIWDKVRDEARSSINNEEFRILASDINGSVLKTARENALKAGVSDLIAFQKLDVKDFSSQKKYGCIICNPPYGERLGEKKQVEELYKTMGKVFSNLNEWSYFILTSYDEFQNLFGRKADKNRKLYNGRIQCYYYEYFGELPPRK